ncbi:MAG: response regulator [Chlorobiales bacterium]|nr:response regulator [Chlorobiales bacterium]
MHTILFVDDEASILTSLSFSFKRNYNVLTAQDGHSAVRIFQTASTPIHVIVSDQRMPGMLGVELLREVKVISPATMRILLTGYSDLQDVISSVNVGEVFRYVNKPWNIDKLRETINQACQFSDRIQLLRESVAANKTVATSLQPRRETHLLFVEPDMISRNALRALFGGDYTVHLAATAAEAFDILQKKPIAVVTTEAFLEEVDGADFLAIIKEKYPDISTILLTDTQDASLAIRLINEGSLFRYLVKPFRQDELKSSLTLAILQHYSSKENPAPNALSFESPSHQPDVSGQGTSMYDALKSVRERIQQRKTY